MNFPSWIEHAKQWIGLVELDVSVIQDPNDRFLWQPFRDDLFGQLGPLRLVLEDPLQHPRVLVLSLVECGYCYAVPVVAA